MNITSQKKRMKVMWKQTNSNPLTQIYLAGSVEYSTSLSWRREWKRDIEALGGYSVFIPGENEEEHPLTSGFKDLAEQNLIEFKEKFTELVVEPCLERVNLSDLVVVKYNGEQTIGTIDEVCTAFRVGIPVLMVSSLPLRKISCWLLSHTTELFKTKEELLTKLK